MSSVHSSFCPYLPIVCPAAILSYLFVPDGCFSIGLLTTPLCQLFTSSSLHRFNQPLPLFPFTSSSIIISTVIRFRVVIMLVHTPTHSSSPLSPVLSPTVLHIAQMR